MYTRTFKLYPFSKKNIPTLTAYADSLFDKAEELESNGLYEEADSAMSRASDVLSVCNGGLHGTEDKYCVWLTGADLAMAKKIMAMA